MTVLFILVAITGFIWWISDRARLRREAIEACPGHKYEYVSVFNEGRMWVRRCRLCPYQEPVIDPELEERLRREFWERRR